MWHVCLDNLSKQTKRNFVWVMCEEQRDKIIKQTFVNQLECTNTQINISWAHGIVHIDLICVHGDWWCE